MMKTRDFLRWYIRSPLGLSTFFAAAATGAALGFAGVSLVWDLLAAGLILVSGFFLSMVLGAGARAAVRERQRDADAALSASLDAAARLGERIAALRLPDPEVKTATDGFVFAFGDCLAACRREATRDPRADAAAEDVLAALAAFLKELDGTALERRFDLPDGDPFPEARSKTLAFLKERTAYVRERRLAVEGGLGGGDRLSIREELR